MSKREDYAQASRDSIKRDFQRIQQQKDEKRGKRIQTINPTCFYAKFSRFFVGRLMELVKQKESDSSTGWYKFIHDADRVALNTAAGHSNLKEEYFLERPKFK